MISSIRFSPAACRPTPSPMTDCGSTSGGSKTSRPRRNLPGTTSCRPSRSWRRPERPATFGVNIARVWGLTMLLVSEPVLGAEEKTALSEVVESGWITMGPRVRAFEEAFAAAHGLPDCVAVSSCTAALHLILLAAGIGPGDEVLVPSLTFAATANSVLYVGAK